MVGIVNKNRETLLSYSIISLSSKKYGQLKEITYRNYWYRIFTIPGTINSSPEITRFINNCQMMVYLKCILAKGFTLILSFGILLSLWFYHNSSFAASNLFLNRRFTIACHLYPAR